MGGSGMDNKEIYGKEKEESVWRQDYGKNFICGTIEE